MPLKRYILNLLFPSVCPVCKASSDEHEFNPICGKCWSSIKKLECPSCRICAIPIASEYGGLCSECASEPPPFSKIICYGIYDGTLKEALHLLKFDGVKRLAKPLSALLAARLEDKFDALVPVPLHKKRLREREFNQSGLLCLHLSRKLNKPLLHNALEKTRETAPQTSLSGAERRRNLQGAFIASKNFSGMRILLVDDIITTGATVRECAKILKMAGAKEVIATAVARSLLCVSA